MKVAYVNLLTNIVESIIIVNSLEDTVPTVYKLVEIPLVEIFASEEERQLYEIIKEIDPNYSGIVKIERHIDLGVTKWTEEREFYEE